MIKNHLKGLTAVVIAVCLFNFQNLRAQSINIIPYPQSVKKLDGEFVFGKSTRIVYDKNNNEIAVALEPLLSKLKQAAGINLAYATQKPRRDFVTVELTDKITQPEGYHLLIGKHGISIEAASPAGVFYAVQSVLQLLPAEIENAQLVQNVQWKITAADIDDKPVFAYRGLMLDVARHFMPYSFLEKMVDLMAMQKMNTFHLHLTDSQGWRFESKKYPKLTRIGAYRKGTPLNTTYDYDSRPTDTLYGGFYTQKQLRKLVAYAKTKFITIIPEIEMPAHSRAALASYPELACLDSTGHTFTYPSQIQDEYCTKDSTFTFLTDILTEVMDVFPSKYIHIAGDEASKVNWKKCPICQKRMADEHLTSVDELQSYFIKRIEKFVNEKGRNIIGWDEILEGGLAPNATVMSWRGEKGGMDAAEQGHKVIMTPEDYCYLDHYQSNDTAEPAAFGGLTTLATVYSYHPLPAELDSEDSKLITGTQGNLWTEYVPTYQHAEYMFFPRSTALAEVAWTGNKLTYDDFTTRLLGYLKRLDDHNVNYSRHLFDIKLNTVTDSVTHQLKAVPAGIPAGFDVYYTTDGTRPTAGAQKYTGPITIQGNAEVNVGVIYNGRLVDDVQKSFTLNKATGKPSTLTTPPNKQYNKGGDHAWNNGILGSDNRFNDGEWLGWNGKDFEGTVDLETPQTVNTVTSRFFNKPSSWIYMPSSVTVSVSNDGVNFKEVSTNTDLASDKDGLHVLKVDMSGITTRYIRVLAKNFGLIPKGKASEGNPAWLFVDELKVE